MSKESFEYTVSVKFLSGKVTTEKTHCYGPEDHWNAWQKVLPGYSYVETLEQSPKESDLKALAKDEAIVSVSLFDFRHDSIEESNFYKVKLKRS